MSKKLTKSKTAPAHKNAYSESSVINLQESVISRVNPDKTVSIVNIELDDICYSLNGIAAEIWSSIDGKKSIKKIKDKILKIHQPPLDLFEEDFAKLITKLNKEKLIIFF